MNENLNLKPSDIVGNTCIIATPYNEHKQYAGKMGRVISMITSPQKTIMFEMLLVSGKKVVVYPEELLHVVDKQFIYCRVCNNRNDDVLAKKPWNGCGKCVMNHHSKKY